MKDASPDKAAKQLEKDKEDGNIKVQEHSPTPSPSSSSSQDEFDFEDANQKFFNLSEVKPLDLKSAWLGNTSEVISKFESKLSQLHREKVSIKQEFLRFAENESRFQMSSLRKMTFTLDRKQLYHEYMQRTRRPIEKLHPSLILNICSYVEESVFLALARLRRVSQIYNLIYRSEDVGRLFSQQDFGREGVGVAMQEKWCERYIAFRSTFLYYKEIKYTVLIPQNSIKEDIELAVDFINEVYKRTYALRSTDFGYFHLLNRFMRHHRIVLALEALTFTDMAVTKKASIVAFSNYLALNPSARRKEEITKTKYLKMIHMVEDEDYRDSLLANSKLSTYLHYDHNYDFAVFIDTLKTANHFHPAPLFDLLVYHLHNELKSSFSRAVAVTEDPIEVGEATLQFGEKQSTCLLSYRIGNRTENERLERVYFPTFTGGTFGHCYIYRGEFYYVVLIKSSQKEIQRWRRRSKGNQPPTEGEYQIQDQF